MTNIIFDSEDFLDTDSMLEDLGYLFEENKPRGIIKHWVLLSKRESRYGKICNHGATGYLDLQGTDLAKAILQVKTDHLEIFDEKGVMKLKFHDHDGTHTCEIKPISETRMNEYCKFESDWLEEKIEFLEEIPSLKVK